MKDLKDYIDESLLSEMKVDEINEIKDFINSLLKKENYQADEYKITGFNEGIRIYFIGGRQAHHEAVSKIGKYIGTQLDKKGYDKVLNTSYKMVIIKGDYCLDFKYTRI